MRILLNDLVIIKTPKATGNIRALVTTGTADATIQPLGKSEGEIKEGVFGREYLIFMEEFANVKKDDRLVDQHGNQYQVTSVVTRQHSAFPFQEVKAVRTD